MSPQGSPSRQQETDSILMNWLGHRVVVKYLAGPSEPMDPEDEKGLRMLRWRLARGYSNYTVSARSV